MKRRSVSGGRSILKTLTLAILLATVSASCSGHQRVVDAYYYPDKGDRSVFVFEQNVGDMNDCRLWAYETANGYEDPKIEAGAYICGIDPEGPPSREDLAKSYRKIAQ